MTQSDLDLAAIGNCAIGALIDRQARIVWCCLPRLDGDPVFHSLLGHAADGGEPRGFWDIELVGRSRSEQEYVVNTAIVVTRQFAADGSAIEVTDFAPRMLLHGRQFRPAALVRRVRPIGGNPRIVVRVRPAFDHGAIAPRITHGSNNLRYAGTGHIYRLTTNAPISYVLEERPFHLEEALSFLLGADETPDGALEDIARMFQEGTELHWRAWTRRLALPLEWQEATIRAAITLKLCTFEETGAIVAALTTSIPEAPGTGRNWDYRYCWLRDAFFVVRALNSLSEVETMEHYLRYLQNVVRANEGERLQPVFGIAQESDLIERELPHLSGFDGHRPVRIGNQAYEHAQHDAYGNVVLAAAQSYFDQRLFRRSGLRDLPALERIAAEAYRVYRLPDSGMWELRTRTRIHSSSVLMCWAACDRTAKICAGLGEPGRAALWRTRAEEIRAALETEAWNEQLGSFVESFGGNELDAGMLLMPEVGFIDARDPRFLSTLAAIERRLRRGQHVFRYTGADDFGTPTTAFTACTFWYIDALARVGRSDEARALFENLLATRNHVGLLAEDVDPATGRQWGNFPQTYCQAGVINAAVRLSRDWESVV